MRREADNWYNRIVRDSRYNDRRAGRHIDPRIPFIDSHTLFEMQNLQQNRCYYCTHQMNWLERRTAKNGLTLERRDNNLPHYNSNCLALCCKSCNSKRYSRDIGLLHRYFSKWKRATFDVLVKVDDDRRCAFVI